MLGARAFGRAEAGARPRPGRPLRRDSRRPRPCGRQPIRSVSETGSDRVQVRCLRPPHLEAESAATLQQLQFDPLTVVFCAMAAEPWAPSGLSHAHAVRLVAVRVRCFLPTAACVRFPFVRGLKEFAVFGADVRSTKRIYSPRFTSIWEVRISSLSSSISMVETASSGSRARTPSRTRDGGVPEQV